MPFLRENGFLVMTLRSSEVVLRSTGGRNPNLRSMPSPISLARTAQLGSLVMKMTFPLWMTDRGLKRPRDSYRARSASKLILLWPPTLTPRSMEIYTGIRVPF